MILGILPVSVYAADEYPWVWYNYTESSGNPTAQGCTVSLVDNDGVGTAKGALKVNVLSKNGTPVYSGVVLQKDVKYRLSAWIKVDDINLNIAKIPTPTFSFIFFTKTTSSSTGYNIVEGSISDFKQGEWVYAEAIWTCTGKADAGGTELNMAGGSTLNFRFGNRNDNWTNVNDSQTYSYLMDDFRIEPVYDEAESNVEESESLRNADFEDGFIKPFWTVEQGAGVTQIDGANSTAKAVRITADEYGIKQKATVYENMIYKIGFWAKAGSDNAVGTDVTVNIDFSEMDGMSAADKIVLPQDSLDKSFDSFTLTDEWEYYECSFVNTAITGYTGKPYLYFTQSGGTVDIAIDEITVEKSDELICDGNFENGLDMWQSTGVTTETVTDDAPDGYTGNVIKVAETENNGTIKQTVPIFGGKTYKIGFWAKGISWNGEDETIKASVTLDRTVTENDIENVTDEDLKLSKEWQYFEYEYTPDSDSHNTAVMPTLGLKFKIGRSRVTYLIGGVTVKEVTSTAGGSATEFSGLDYLIAGGETIAGETVTVTGKRVGDANGRYLVRTFVSENTRGYVLEDYSYVDGDIDVSKLVTDEMIGRKIKFEAIPIDSADEKMKTVTTDTVKPLFKINTECTSGFESNTVSYAFDIINNKQDCNILVMLAQYDENMSMISLKETYMEVDKYDELLGQYISDDLSPSAVLAKLMIWEGVSSVNNSSVSYASHSIEKQ